MREIARDEGLAHELACGGDGGEVLEAVSETGAGLILVRDAEIPADDGGAVLFQGHPEAIAGEVAEGKLRVVLVVVFADKEEAVGEAVAQVLAPRDAVRCGLAFVDEIKGGEQEQRLVRPFMTLSADADDPDVEVVKAFDGGIQMHDR